MNMVENISLLSNARDNGFVGVNMYVDDEGAIKGLPTNMRASEIAHCCGRPLDVSVGGGLVGTSASEGKCSCQHELLAFPSPSLPLLPLPSHASGSAAPAIVGYSCWRQLLATATAGTEPPHPPTRDSLEGLDAQVKGDAFLARVFDDGDGFERLDLPLTEVNSGADWVQQAKAQNERKRREVGDRGREVAGGWVGEREEDGSRGRQGTAV